MRLALFLLSAFLSFACARGELTLQHSSRDDSQWTLVLNLSSVKPGAPKLSYQPKPPRIVIDLPPQALTLPDKAELKHTPVRLIQTQKSRKTLRVVLFLRGPIQRVSRHSSRFEGQSLFLLEFQTQDRSGAPAPQTQPSPAEAPTLKTPEPPPPATPPKPIHKGHPGASEFVVIIDPGHGGHDTGALGQLNGRTYTEKEVVLQIGKKIAEEINKREGMHAYLTREDDHFLPLRERQGVARTHHASLFISVHANSLPGSNVAGTAPFILSLHGADSEMARWISQEENEELFSTDESLKGHSKDVQDLLLDLSTQGTILASERFGDRLLKSFREAHIKLLHGRVEKAAFVVLKSLDIPSTLLETGFMSSPPDLTNLLNPDYQRRYAVAVAKSVEGFKDELQGTQTP